MSSKMHEMPETENDESAAREKQPSLKEVLDIIKTLPRLQAHERRVVLREVIASCDVGDIQVLQRLLGQTTQSGFDLVSSLPSEISHSIFLYLDGMDLVQCRAVCRPWRSMVCEDMGLWKAKMQAWNPAESSILKDSQLARWSLSESALQMTPIVPPTSSLSSLSLLAPTASVTAASVGISNEALLDRIAHQTGFMGWESALVQELALKRHWRQGRYVHEMTLTLARNIKPTLLAWPYLFVIDDWPKLYRISLENVRQDRLTVIPVGLDRYASVMELQGHGAVSCMAWDSFFVERSSRGEREDKQEEVEMETLSSPLPLALGGFLRSVRVCNPETKATVALPDVHHGFPLHLCYLKDQVLSVTLDGQITYFHKGEDYRPIRSCTVATKVIQIASVHFGSHRFEREHNGDLLSWGEAVCLGHEDGVIVKDEHSETLCHIHLEMGSKLLQFQAISDIGVLDMTTAAHTSSWHYRNELLILFEDANTRQRRVIRIQMDAGFRDELSREVLTHSFYLGRGGDARDSMAMYRDRIGIVTHRNCSSDLGHYCVLRLLDLKEDVAISTEYAQHSMENEDDKGEQGEEEEEEEEEGQGNKEQVKRVQRRGRLIHLNDFAGHKAACRILAMDHARIVLGMGSRIVKVLCLV